MFNNIKRLLADDSFYFGVLIVLASITSFGLGRWSIHDLADAKSTEPVELQALLPVNLVGPQQQISSSTVVTPPVVPKVEKKYVASKKGTKYHLLWCSGAKTIKEENKLYFGSKEEAEKAGYGPASNCKGI
ncbi:MAG: hypothetical protein RLZZ76_436 [Candidatus Parcubacteria bacterium]|jgi:hypothetical protein